MDSVMTYRVNLRDPGETGFSYIQFYRWALALRKVNIRRVRCVECGQECEPGGCIYKSEYRGNGYVCIPCVKELITRHGEMGYTENVISNLQACFTQHGRWTAQEVIEALCKQKENTTVK